MPNYLSRMKPNGANGTEYKLKDEELREVVQTIQDEVAGTQTATGNPITLTDGSETYAQGLSVELEPKQDLHGYDFPWVGGAGKNILPMTVEGIKAANTHGTWNGNAFTFGGMTFTILTDESENITGFDIDGSLVNTAASRFVISKGVNLTGSYLLNGGLSNSLYLQVTNYDETVQIDTNKGGDLEISNLDNYTIRFIVTATQSHTKVFPMLRLATETDSTFAPYSNICPISGYEGVEVEDVGFNQWDEVTESGYYFKSSSTGKIASASSASTIRSKNPIPVIPNETYYATSNVYKCFVTDAEGYVLIETPNHTITMPDNAAYLYFFCENKTTYNNDICINISKTTGTPKNGDYLPYQSRTASVTFGQTVYGGSVDVTNGGTDDDRNEVVFDGSSDESWSYSGYAEQGFYIPLMDMKRLLDYTDAIKCDKLKVCDGHEGTGYNTSSYAITGYIGGADRYPGQNWLYVKTTSSMTSVSDFKAWLASNPLQVCYKKVTPTTISTPPTDLKLLQDTNNLTTNGTTITLDYIPNNSIGDAVKASEEYTDRAVDALGDLAHINKDGSTSTKFLRGDGTWQNTGIVKEILLNTTVFQGDDVTFIPPASYNFLVFEMYFDADGACGSAIVTDLNYFETVTIIANNTMTEHVCSLHYSSNQFSVMGSFGGDSANLRVTAF